MKVNLWDHPSDCLITYCERCHDYIHVIIKNLDGLMSNIPDVKKSDYAHIIILSFAMMQSINNEDILLKIHPYIKSFIDNQDG